MRRDPHIRSYADPAPYVPGTETRFRWPTESEMDGVRRLRDGVQEEGRGMYLLRAPYDGDTLLVEAYYPDEMRAHYARDWLDPFRRYDYEMGRLVAIHVHDQIKLPHTKLGPQHVNEIARNNRAAMRDLKRQVTPLYLAQAIRDAQEKDDEQVITRWTDFYMEAIRMTKRYEMTPHVGPARSKALGGDVRNSW